MAKWKGRTVRGKIRNIADDAFQPWTKLPLKGTLPKEIEPKKRCPVCRNNFCNLSSVACDMCRVKQCG